ncbi:hypothetical protein HBH98_066960 [Parastagonospora nodorum]|nr:hypothetical protein HBH53_054110 [Parastagonospora nodorum]KAH4124923.1 hypothetical protein HBH47_064240 [Parastagonospora nodorum]KAH4139304.1 hypothetical protein HBH45_100750 [Parastagonospora nodorum]KAH4166626.1 hypothetical protein HBH44_061910 [Parastagonospora nodorum]KAH4173892.1 hypothetical protein HBH43_084360 [Parastagonospora nodorum]
MWCAHGKGEVTREGGRGGSRRAWLATATKEAGRAVKGDEFDHGGCAVSDSGWQRGCWSRRRSQCSATRSVRESSFRSGMDKERRTLEC